MLRAISRPENYMIKGIYTSASGMLPRLRKQEVTANNLSNVSAPGYKKDMLFTRELSRAEKKIMPKKSDWEVPMVNSTYTDFTAGTFDKTGNPLDFAIDGDGFFQLELDDGSRVLTRAGNFEVNPQGQIAFPGGGVLIGEGGPIEVGGGVVSVSATGEVAVDGSAVGRIVPVTVSDLTQLKKIGGLMFSLPEGVQPEAVANASIQQGYLETSNVDIVSEMIEMIISFREYEANAKAVQTQDQSLDHLFNKVAGKG